MAGPPRIVFKDSPSSLPMPTIVFRNKDDTLTDAAALVRSAAFSIALPTPQTLYSSVRKTEDLDPTSAPQLSFSELAAHGADLTAEQAQALAAGQAQMAVPCQATVNVGHSIPQAAAEAAYPDMLASTTPSLYGQGAGQYPEGMHAASMHQQAPSLQGQQQYAAQMYSMLQHRPQDVAGQMLQDLPHQQSHVQPDPIIAHQYASTLLEHEPEAAGVSDLPNASVTGVKRRKLDQDVSHPAAQDEAAPLDAVPEPAPLSPLHDLGGNLHDLADIASLQNGDTQHNMLNGRLAEASERLAEVSDPALRSMLEDIAAGRIPPAALFGSLGSHQEALMQTANLGHTAHLDLGQPSDQPASALHDGVDSMAAAAPLPTAMAPTLAGWPAIASSLADFHHGHQQPLAAVGDLQPGHTFTHQDP